MVNESQPRHSSDSLIRSVREPTTRILSQVAKSRRKLNGPLITTTAVATVCVGAAVGLPMIQSLRDVDTFLMPPPGSTATHDSPQASLPSTSLPEQQQSQPVLPVISPPRISSVCETQEGTVEGQLPSGEPVLPATMDRPSIFVVSPERSDEQSFSVRPVYNSDTNWYIISEGEDVGIIGILTSDTQFKTSNEQAVWGKSCEPTSHVAVEEVISRTDDLCRRSEFGLKAVVVFHIGADGKPVEMNKTDC